MMEMDSLNEKNFSAFMQRASKTIQESINDLPANLQPVAHKMMSIEVKPFEPTASEWDTIFATFLSDFSMSCAFVPAEETEYYSVLNDALETASVSAGLTIKRLHEVLSPRLLEHVTYQVVQSLIKARQDNYEVTPARRSFGKIVASCAEECDLVGLKIPQNRLIYFAEFIIRFAPVNDRYRRVLGSLLSLMENEQQRGTVLNLLLSYFDKNSCRFFSIVPQKNFSESFDSVELFLEAWYDKLEVANFEGLDMAAHLKFLFVSVLGTDIYLKGRLRNFIQILIPRVSFADLFDHSGFYPSFAFFVSRTDPETLQLICEHIFKEENFVNITEKNSAALGRILRSLFIRAQDVSEVMMRERLAPATAARLVQYSQLFVEVERIHAAFKDALADPRINQPIQTWSGAYFMFLNQLVASGTPYIGQLSTIDRSTTTKLANTLMRILGEMKKVPDAVKQSYAVPYSTLMFNLSALAHEFTHVSNGFMLDISDAYDAFNKHLMPILKQSPVLLDQIKQSYPSVRKAITGVAVKKSVLWGSRDFFTIFSVVKDLSDEHELISIQSLFLKHHFAVFSKIFQGAYHLQNFMTEAFVAAVLQQANLVLDGRDTSLSDKTDVLFAIKILLAEPHLSRTQRSLLEAINSMLN